MDKNFAKAIDLLKESSDLLDFNNWEEQCVASTDLVKEIREYLKQVQNH
jgi:hypothetical protein